MFIIAGIMFQDLTVLHSVMATTEKQGKKQKYKNQNTQININTHLEVKELIVILVSTVTLCSKKKGHLSVIFSLFPFQGKTVENYYSSKK